MEIDTKSLEKIQYFAGMSSDELDSVKKYIISERKIAKGEILLLDSEQSDYMYFIISGAVKVYKRSLDGKEQILNVASTGETLNDVSTFDGGGCATDMLAMMPVLLYVVKQKDMRVLVAENPKIALNVARVLASKVRRDSSLVEELSFDQVISRLARLILKQAPEGERKLPLFTQQDLAAMVGTSRVVVNRSLRTMEEKGAIRLERRRIVIIDEEALKALVT
ncbi:Crp/Fnr family transcriptional regulator [Chloroflexota bacterium]